MWLSPIAYTRIAIGIIVLSCIIARIAGQGDGHWRILSEPRQDAQLTDAGRSVPVYPALATLEEVAHLDPEKASDMARLQHITESDAILRVPSGTRVHVLRVSVRYAYVEIAEGAYAGVRGYTMAAFVQAY